MQGKVKVTVEIEVCYKAVMNGSNVIVLEASLPETYYPVSVFPAATREQVLLAVCEDVRIQDYEARFNREIV